MTDLPYRLLIVAERESGAPAWCSQNRFHCECAERDDVEPRLRFQTFDALIWLQGALADNLVDRVSIWKNAQPRLQIMVSPSRAIPERVLVKLMRAGCFDVLGRVEISAPKTADLLAERIDFVRARQMERLQVRQGIEYAGLVGESPEMLGVYDQIQRVARLRSPVLITGQPGTGKGLVAHAIHALSARNGRPFVTVDCACLAPGLVESELYGVTRGAGGDRAGLAQAAQDGTLFLDEVAEMPLDLQPKLLRLLEQGEIQRVGGAQNMSVNVRALSASRRDLDELVDRRLFRLDLYYRLNVLHIVLPPLRARAQDIPLLARHFASRHNFRGEPVTLAESALAALACYYWPGNVRELKDAIESSVATLTRNSIHAHNLPRRVTETEREFVVADETVHLRTLERRAIRAALQRAHGDKAAAAGLLGTSIATLYRKLKQMQGETETRPFRGDEQSYVM